MFIDTAGITVKAGNGGNGVNSFYRDKITLKGHPDGGDGGNGGNIIIRASADIHTLVDVQYCRIFKTKDGGHGSSKQKRGNDGKELVIDVPCGTSIYSSNSNELLADLVREGDGLIVARGGKGGRGNRSHKNATNGEEGEENRLFLELKLLAEIGIIGFPNTGKSTLISRISNARPRIANFPFTTKNPILAVVEYGDITFRVVEIPGLIEGSHKGKGLGDKFLRHAERTKLLIHLLDLSKQKPEEVLSDYYSINQELGLYSRNLGRRQQIIVGNKIDVAEGKRNFEFLRNKLNKEIIAISAKEGIGIDRLIKKATSALEGYLDE